MIRKFFVIGLLLLLYVPALADEVVLRPSARFSIPITSAGKDTVGMAVFGFDGRMTVFYSRNGEVATIDFIVSNGNLPQPGPDPSPNPQPKPQPVKVAFLYVIYESTDNRQSQADVINSKAWKEEAERRGVRWLALDKDVSSRRLPVATQKAVAFGLPAVVALDKNGFSTVEKMPDTPDGMLTAVKRIAGGSP